MFHIQVFSADKEFLFYLPMSHKLSSYMQVMEFVRNEPQRNDAGEDIYEDSDRTNAVMKADLLGKIGKMQRNPDSLDKEEHRAINAAIMSLVLGAHHVYENFFEMAVGHYIQIALPESPSADADIQWAKAASREDHLETMDIIAEGLSQEEKDRYLAQTEEIIEYCQMRLARLQHKLDKKEEGL